MNSLPGNLRCTFVSGTETRAISQIILSLLLVLLKVIILQGVGFELYEKEEFSNTLPQPKDWCYERKRNCGERYWSSLKESSACNSKNYYFQSPINLPGNISHLVTHSKTIQTHYLNKDDYLFHSFTITNTGKTLQIRPNLEWEPSEESFGYQKAYTVTIRKQIYYFHSLHFHWGSRDDIGSEHAIDGKSFPIEVHLVFYHGEYRDIKYPLSYWTMNRGIAVIAVLIESDVTDPPLDAEEHFHSYSNVLLPVVGTFKFLKFTESKYSTSPLPVRELFRGNKQVAYRYIGSLTTPPCRENVLWFVIREPVIVPMWHIRQFRETAFFGSGSYFNNFRSLKKLPVNTKHLRGNVTRNIEIVILHFNTPNTSNMEVIQLPSPAKKRKSSKRKRLL